MLERPPTDTTDTTATTTASTEPRCDGVDAAPATTERRFDRAELAPPVRSAEGFITVEGFVARPGVYVYRNADGSTRRELVPASTLHDPASLATLANKPITLGHAVGPQGWQFVDPSNFRELGVGVVGGASDFEIADDGRVIVRMTVHRRDAIDAINAGTCELSPQYDAEIERRAGNDPQFGPYDCVQKSRTYNAASIVPVARGGRGLYLRADSADAEIDANPPPREDPMIRLPLAMIALIAAGTCRRSDGLAPDAPITETTKIEGLDAVVKRADGFDAVAAAVGVEPAKVDAVTAAVSALAKRPEPRADADIEADRLAYADERIPLIDLAKRLEVPYANVGNEPLRKAIAIKVRPEARADAAADYYRGIVDVAASASGDPLAGLAFNGKAPADPNKGKGDQRADGDVVEPAIVRHARAAHAAAAPKPLNGDAS